jgi:prolyl-tRNA synthetase
MAKKLVQNITAREEDFAQWYTDVVREAKLCDYSGVKGCMNYLPNGYALWENIQKELDARFKETGVENVYLPVMIPESLLQKEKDIRIKSFGHAGDGNLHAYILKDDLSDEEWEKRMNGKTIQPSCACGTFYKNQ